MCAAKQGDGGREEGKREEDQNTSDALWRVSELAL